MKHLVAVLFLVISCIPCAQAAGGLVLYTTPGSQYVNAVQYVTFSSPSSHLSYATGSDGTRTQIQSAGIIAQIPFPDASCPVSESDAASIVAQTEMFAGQYPQYARMLQSIAALWKRSAEASKVAQGQAAVPKVSATPEIGEKIITPGPKSEIPIVRTKSGQTLNAVTITRFENAKAVIMHSTGIDKVLLSDIANLSAMPPDVKSAIEAVQAAVAAKKKVDADRIAAEKQEQERVAKAAREAEEKRLAEIEIERVEREKQAKAKEALNDRLAQIAQARVAKEAEATRIANEKREQERRETAAEQNRQNGSANNTGTPNQEQIEKVRFERYKASNPAIDKINLDASNGIVEATYYLARICNGLAMRTHNKEDILNAMKLLREASEKGHSLSQTFLGRVYLISTEVEHNEAEGIRWLQIAASNGNTEARSELLARHIPPVNTGINGNNESSRNGTNTKTSAAKDIPNEFSSESIPSKSDVFSPIGKTPQQCDARYLDPLGIEADGRRVYKSSGIILLIHFYGNKADCVTYRKVEEGAVFSSNDLALLREINSNKSPWRVAAAKSPTDMSWGTEDGKFSAFYYPNGLYWVGETRFFEREIINQ